MDWKKGRNRLTQAKETKKETSYRKLMERRTPRPSGQGEARPHKHSAARPPAPPGVSLPPDEGVRGSTGAPAGRRRAPRFDLIAGNVCLDFVNTLDDRHNGDRHIQPKELLETYLDLARFGEDTGLLSETRAERLIERSSLDPAGAQKALLRGRELREAIHDVFWAVMNQRPVPSGALARLNADVQTAAGRMRLVPAKGGGFEWSFDDFGDFDGLLWPIARAAGDLLAGDQLAYVRACSSKTCEWFFLDTSKNHHRRWCDMTRCGNRAKVRSFYERKKSNS
jgi:predicted RNA-binding Zn ribbon-like protein